MRTATYNVDVASDRRRRENEPRHILCSPAVCEWVRFHVKQGNKNYETLFHNWNQHENWGQTVKYQKIICNMHKKSVQTMCNCTELPKTG